jgi:hypothetical protein
MDREKRVERHYPVQHIVVRVRLMNLECVQRLVFHNVLNFFSPSQVRIDHPRRFCEHILRIRIKLTRTNRGRAHNELSLLKGVPLFVSENHDVNVPILIRFLRLGIDNPDCRAARYCFLAAPGFGVAAPRLLNNLAPIPFSRQQEREPIL